jgi:hypothetical protein
MSARKRSSSGSKRPKEKVVYIYEMILRGEDPKKDFDEFWNEFFLLNCNTEILEIELLKLSVEQLVTVKSNISLLFTESIKMLSSGEL